MKRVLVSTIIIVLFFVSSFGRNSNDAVKIIITCNGKKYVRYFYFSAIDLDRRFSIYEEE